MLDSIATYPQSLWLAAFLIYVLDVARLVAPGRILIVEQSGGRLRTVLARVPFDFKRNELYFPAVFTPWLGVFLSRWIPDEPKCTLSLDRMDEVRKALLPFRVTSLINFAALFLIAPALTVAIGLGGAVLYVVPVVYFINMGVGTCLWWNRSNFGLKRSQATWLVFDSLLCAPYGANWVKRICRGQPELTDDVESLMSRFNFHERQALSHVLADRRGELSLGD